MGAKPPYPHAAILIAAAPASSLLKIGKLRYHISRPPTSGSELSGSLRGFIRGASGIKSALP